jgi:hypothetical protein
MLVMNVILILVNKLKWVQIWTGGLQFPAGARFFFLHSFQTGFGAHPASYSMGRGGSFTGDKAAEA